MQEIPVADGAAEITAPKHNPPVLVKDRSLEPLYEPVRPCMSGFRASVLHVQISTCLVEISFELTASIRQHSPQLPTSLLHLGSNDILEERGCLLRVVGWHNLGHRVRAGRITRSQLPQLADALEVADVEGVNTHELARFLCLHMTSLSSCQVLPGSLGQQSGALCAVDFKNEQPLSPGSQPQTVECSPDRGR